MPLTSRKRLLDRAINNRDASLIVIATEGKETEAQYFSIFRNPKINVVVIPAIDDKSAPVYVLEKLDNFASEYQLAEDDTLWLMIDVDHRRSKELATVCQDVLQKGYGLAVSNPCFEAWLYLHFAEIAETSLRCVQLESKLRKALGSYNKSKLDLEKYRTNIWQAIERAKALHSNPTERWPNSVGTHVYKIVEKLI